MSIVLKDLVKFYGKQLIVNNFSMEINDGEFIALLGASGSGKSTVLRMIAGLTVPSSGSIELNGRDVTKLPPQKREVGLVFQNYAIFKHMTIAENIEFGLRVRGVNKKQRKDRQEELLELVGLSGMGSRYPHQISGGQRQRVALARALAYKPSILLLDEPFGALDAGIRSQVRENVREIQRKLKIATLLVTHDQEEAFELADRIGIIEKGRLIEVGDARSLYDKPQSSYTASFIGSGTLMVGRVRSNKIKLGSVKLDFPENSPKHNDGDPVRVLFRPENVICTRQEITKENNLSYLGKGIIEDRRFSGSFIRIRVKILNLSGVRPLNFQLTYGEGIAVTSLMPSASTENEIKIGDTCHVYISKFNVLAPGGLRMLIKCKDVNVQSSAWRFAAMLGAAAHGRGTLLHVAAPNTSIEAIRKKLIETYSVGLDPNFNLEFRIRQGFSQYEMLLTAQEEFFEIAVIERSKFDQDSYSNLEPSTVSLLEEARLPVVLVAEESKKLEKILVCTAAGEPGKSDILLGARLARQTDALVTVLHLLKPGDSSYNRERADRHMRDAKNLLTDLGIRSTIESKEAPALETIVETAETGRYDLVVLGAPQPQENVSQYARSFTARVLSKLKMPVLIVPERG